MWKLLFGRQPFFRVDMRKQLFKQSFDYNQITLINYPIWKSYTAYLTIWETSCKNNDTTDEIFLNLNNYHWKQ